MLTGVPKVTLPSLVNRDKCVVTVLKTELHFVFLLAIVASLPLNPQFDRALHIIFSNQSRPRISPTEFHGRSGYPPVFFQPGLSLSV